MSAASNISISIITPAYNAGQFIDECLAHILPQMGAGHEAIVIDDGSRDDTAARVRALAAAHPHCALRLVQQHNQGVAQARNEGLRLARGDYILFIDSDDLLQPHMLARLDAVIAAHAPDAIATAFRLWHPGRPHKDRDVSIGYPPDTLISGQDAILPTFFASRHLYGCMHVIRRDIYAQFGQPLFPSGRVFEDAAVTPRLLARCRTLYHLPQRLLAYRQHAASITRSITARYCLDLTAALGLSKGQLERDGVSAVVRDQYDVVASHFYIGAVKHSYQLPASEGGAVREQLKAIYRATLFGPPEQVLAKMESASLLTADRRGDQRCVRQVRQALANNLLFHVKQTVSRQFKQRLRRVRAAAN